MSNLAKRVVALSAEPIGELDDNEKRMLKDIIRQVDGEDVRENRKYVLIGMRSFATLMYFV